MLSLLVTVCILNCVQIMALADSLSGNNIQEECLHRYPVIKQCHLMLVQGQTLESWRIGCKPCLYDGPLRIDVDEG